MLECAYPLFENKMPYWTHPSNTTQKRL